MSHSPEPWSLRQQTDWDAELGCEMSMKWIISADGINIACVPGNYERIVACVNACRGIPTEVLKGGLKAFGGHLQDLVHDLNQSNNPEVAKIAANLSSLSSVITDRYQEEQ